MPSDSHFFATVDNAVTTHHKPQAEIATRQSKAVAARQSASSRHSVGYVADYVTIPIAAAMTGYSPKAIRRKIEVGAWLEGSEFRRAPDGHVLISMKGYERWVERGRA
jgi:hypothetical protein